MTRARLRRTMREVSHAVKGSLSLCDPSSMLWQIRRKIESASVEGISSKCKNTGSPERDFCLQSARGDKPDGCRYSRDWRCINKTNAARTGHYQMSSGKRVNGVAR